MTRQQRLSKKWTLYILGLAIGLFVVMLWREFGPGGAVTRSMFKATGDAGLSALVGGLITASPMLVLLYYWHRVGRWSLRMSEFDEDDNLPETDHDETDTP